MSQSCEHSANTLTLSYCSLLSPHSVFAVKSWNNTDNVININITLCRFLRKWSALIGDFFLLSFSASFPFSFSHSCKYLYRKGDILSHFLRSTADFWNLRVIVKISLVSNMFYNITEACSLNQWMTVYLFTHNCSSSSLLANHSSSSITYKAKKRCACHFFRK